MAVQKRIHAIAITDHDTIEGARLALQSKVQTAPLFLPGVEISTQAPSQFKVNGSLHLLGYGIDVDNRPLADALETLQQARRNRVPRIVKRLNDTGIEIQLNQVAKEVGSGAPGRPHIAKVLMKMGVVASMDEAFDRLLGKNRPGYVDKERIDCHRAMDLIRNAGGVPVLAHPCLIKGKGTFSLEDLVRCLCRMGLMGIEAYYPEHSPRDVTYLLALARNHDLLVTGGTDFHGDVTPHLQMGKGDGQMHIPFSVYQALVDALESM
jgi:predicted metal-dependent phosphoesterase TrpH